MSDVSPAVAADQWADASGPAVTLNWEDSDYGRGIVIFLHLLMPDNRLDLSNDNAEGAYSVTDIAPSARHSMAALALHGQPFGFTHEDVRFLAALIDGTHPDDAESIRGLARRISALLPPEAP